jgi:hypothetical protein
VRSPRTITLRKTERQVKIRRQAAPVGVLGVIVELHIREQAEDVRFTLHSNVLIPNV